MSTHPSSSVRSVFLSGRAYTKALMHSVKHPSASVNGIFVGRMVHSEEYSDDSEDLRGEDPSCERNKKGGVKEKGKPKQTGSKGGYLLVEDSIPLFHSHILSPMMELGFDLVDEFCRQSHPHPKHIVGYYHVEPPSEAEADSARTDGAKLAIKISPACRTVADKVAENCEFAFLCTIDVSHLEAAEDERVKGSSRPAIDPMGCAELFLKQNGMWKPIPSDQVILTDEAKQLSGIVISDGTYLSLVDFDDHLYSSTLSPLNENLLDHRQDFLDRDETHFWKIASTRRDASNIDCIDSSSSC